MKLLWLLFLIGCLLGYSVLCKLCAENARLYDTVIAVHGENNAGVSHSRQKWWEEDASQRH